ncbi:MAG: malto-oligosyltrehalose synthase [Candidatus Dormibacteria bacterium]
MSAVASPVPPLVATYRLQLHQEFGFAQATAIVPYLAELGISHLYLSPVLQATPGSTHGYDQCDPTRLSDDLGGDAAFRALAAAARAHGLGIVLDIVPNHMASSRHNPWWWEVLRTGRDGRAGVHFDIDWDDPDPGLHGRVMVPVLGEPLDRSLADGNLTLERTGDSPVLAYFDERFPLAADPGDRPVADLLGEQHYALAFWRDASTRLNYRRFFDINTLVALREEDPAVFVTLHDLVLDLVMRGDVQGLRVDHVDGLRDPGAYLENLRRLAPEAWLLVEKILEPGEHLPATWPVDGTTGYDFIHRLQGVFIDPAAEPALTAFYREFTGLGTDYDTVAREAKREAAERLFQPDINRLGRLLEKICAASGVPASAEERSSVITAIAVALPVYRTYLSTTVDLDQTSRAMLEGALEATRGSVDDTLRAVAGRALLGDGRSADETEFAARFQQFSGPLMAKGVEDTTFYRYNRMICLNEVGGSPGRFGVSVEEFHAANADTAQHYPRAMLASSTHDTKRSEDVRARLALLSLDPGAWVEAVRRWSQINAPHRRGGFPDRNAEYLLYQSLVGAWPLTRERAVEFMTKAAREAKRFTNWTDPDQAYEEALTGFVGAVFGDRGFQADLAEFVGPLISAGERVSLAQALVKLTAPGVPDIYQGTEVFEYSLVDPDNRRPVDYSALQALMSASREDDAAPGSAKHRLVRAVLAARREAPAAFAPGSTYTPLAARGPASSNVLAYARGTRDQPYTIVVAVTRLALAVPAGLADTHLDLGPGAWSSAVGGHRTVNGPAPSLAGVLGESPGALLVRQP